MLQDNTDDIKGVSGTEGCSSSTLVRFHGRHHGPVPDLVIDDNLHDDNSAIDYGHAAENVNAVFVFVVGGLDDDDDNIDDDIDDDDYNDDKVDDVEDEEKEEKKWW